MLVPDPCGPRLLLSLPDDVFAMVLRFLFPRDICNLTLCCRSLHVLAACEKLWLTQCEMLGLLPHKDLVEWRKGLCSYKALCRFLASVRPLIGTWVHQNPELGNLVYVMPGFVSVVGCRVIPQELGPLGIHDGPILWAAVFEVIGGFDGSPTFFLHGREGAVDHVYHGSVKYIEKSCNVLLLEVEPRKQGAGADLENPRLEVEVGNSEAVVPFNRLAFSDRRKLLQVTMSHVRQEDPRVAIGLIFPRLRGDDHQNFEKDLVLLRERRTLLSQMYGLGSSGQISDEGNSEETVGIECSSALASPLEKEDGHRQSTKRKSLGVNFWGSLKQILRRSSSSSNRISKKLGSSHEVKYARLQDFLGSSDTIGLTLRASTVKLSSYRAWPINMHDSWFALYKMPLRVPSEDQVYAGLWGGTFGWPPGKPSEDKPGKALFFLLLSYQGSLGKQLLVATKILEGTHYVLHPNGSAMFIVNIDEPSSEPFPLDDTDADNSSPFDIEHAFAGEGIANGYGFRYPGSKPGSLFVFRNGILAFIWKESRAVLTLQRVDLQELLKKGERVPSLPPIVNFSYSTKSFSNVFTGFPDSPSSSSSPR